MRERYEVETDQVYQLELEIPPPDNATNPQSQLTSTLSLVTTLTTTMATAVIQRNRILNALMTNIDNSTSTLTMLLEQRTFVYDQLMDEVHSQMRQRVRRIWAWKNQSTYWEQSVVEWPIDVFKSRFRISRELFTETLTYIQDDIIKQDTRLRCSLSPEKRLAVALYYLCSGSTFAALADIFGIGVSTANQITKEVCHFITLRLPYPHLPVSEGERRILTNSFAALRPHPFPGVLGCTDGSHIPIFKPIDEPADYYCYKKFHSIILMAVAGPKRECLFFNIGCAGKNNDAFAYEFSGLKDWAGNLPSDYHLLGDAAFPLSKGMMKSFAGDELTIPEDEAWYNFVLSSTRMEVECMFGLIKGRFRCLLKKLDLRDIRAICEVITSCVLLHNLIIENGNQDMELDQDDLTDINLLSNEGNEEEYSVLNVAGVDIDDIDAIAKRNMIKDDIYRAK